MGDAPPKGFSFAFRPLWQTKDTDRAAMATQITGAVVQAVEQGLIGRKTALEEMRQSSRVTGLWSNITDEMIAEAEDDPPPASEVLDPQDANAEGGDEPPEDPGS